MTIKDIKIENFSNSSLNNYFNLIKGDVAKTTPIEELAKSVETWAQFHNLKSGRGGSHIWVSDKKSNRLGVIYYA